MFDFWRKKRILCFGDSNTWGLNPHQEFSRYSKDIRWPGRLQKILGRKYKIDEQGENGRTTNLNDKFLPGRNGQTDLEQLLEKNHRYELVILSLGTNDLKTYFNRPTEEIAKAIETLVNLIQSLVKNRKGKPTRVLLLAPTMIDESVPHLHREFHGAQTKSEQLGKLYDQVAKKQNCFFLDLAQHVRPSQTDGCHYDDSTHLKIATLLGEMIKVMEL